MQTGKKPMSRPRGLSEWAFMLVLVMLCITLAAFQYKWTGQISRSEIALLQTSLSEGLHEFCQAFDAELTEGRRALTPEPPEIEQRGLEAAHRERFEAWKASGARPIYKRIRVAIPKGKELELYEIGAGKKTFAATSWPEEWSTLRENLQNKLPPNHSEPFRDVSGALVEFPVFDARRAKGTAGEIEWMILELDLEYARKSWIPELLKRYLSANVQALLTSLKVETVTEPQQPIFSAGAATNDNKAKVTSVRFNRQGSSGSRIPLAGGWWVLEARMQPGRIEGLVSAARWGNLGVALALNLSLIGAGLAFLRYTRRSRVLAEQQMRFVANVSHELRTPLTVIRGAAHNLKKGVLEDRDRQKSLEYVGLIEQHAADLSAMVQQILDLGKAKTMLGTRAIQAVDIEKAVRQAVAATEEETRSCRVDVQLAPELLSVSGDVTALQRAFQNLIVNAAKHGGKGGWIGVTGIVDEESEPAVVEVQVSDRGEGIPQEELLDIFEPFYRGAAAETEQVRGSGLGLSLVKEIVEAHGGSVAVHSERGRGTTFTVRLPASNGHGTA